MKNVIAVVDSGLGGKNILWACERLMPNENFVYFADTKNAPYGNKPRRELLKIAENLVQNVLDIYDPKIIVLGCNTLTAVAIKHLREKFKDVVFVGTEPAIKPALKKYSKNEVVLFATKNTCKYYKNIKKIYIKNLPKLIDENINNLNVINPILIKYFLKKKYKNIKGIILGCTHFIYLKENLNNILGKNIEFFDNSEGVARQVKRLSENIKFHY